MVSRRHLSLAVFLGMAASSAAATECGVHNTTLAEPFAGRWRDKTGDFYDIAPGKISRTYALPPAAGAGTKSESYRFVATSDGEDTGGAVMDCRNLTAGERDSIDWDMGSLSEAATAPDSDTRRDYRRMLELFRAKLAHPPYPVLALTYYEDQQWLILLKPDHLLDVWYGEGDFSVQLYERVQNR